jgi:hypothetical protein
MAIKKRFSHNIIYCSECHGLVNESDSICIHCNRSFNPEADSLISDTGHIEDLLIYSESGLILFYDEFHPPTELINNIKELAKLGTSWESDLLKNKYKSEYLFYIDTYGDYEDEIPIPILLTFNNHNDELRQRHYRKSINKYLLNLTSSNLTISKLDNVIPDKLLPPFFKNVIHIPAGNYSICVSQFKREEEYDHILTKKESKWFKLSNFLLDIGYGFSFLSVFFMLLLSSLVMPDIWIIILINFILWLIIIFLRELPSIRAVRKKTSDYQSSVENLPFYLLEFNITESLEGLTTGGIRFDEEFN